MILRSLIAVGALLTASHAYADDCWQKADAVPSLTASAAQHDAGISVYKGEHAQAFLDVVNSVGDPTDFKADEIIVIVSPASQMGFVWQVHGECVERAHLKLSLNYLVPAIKAAEQNGV